MISELKYNAPATRTDRVLTGTVSPCEAASKGREGGREKRERGKEERRKGMKEERKKEGMKERRRREGGRAKSLQRFNKPKRKGMTSDTYLF